MDKTKIDLNAPAFGQGAQKLEDLTSNSSVEESTHKEVVAEEESSVEETKVPYSRFKKFHDEARQARQEAEEWRNKAEQLERRPTRYDNENSTEMPSYWKELYGDSDASKKGWIVQQKREEEIEQRAYEAGQRGAQELETIQRERIDSNVETIDENFEMLEDFVGRNLTTKEQSSILDIVDDYTAKDRNGNYEGAIMPFDKAWEIYELKQNSGKSSQRKDRDAVALLSSASSQGDTSSNEEQNKTWNPLARGTWRNRL